MREVDEEGRKYLNGFCDAFAIALHDAGYGEIAAWTNWHVDPDFDDERFPEPFHVVVVDRDTGEWMDVRGKHTRLPDSTSLIGKPVAVTLEPCTREEAIHLLTFEGVSDNDIDQAREHAVKLGMISDQRMKSNLAMG